MMDDQLSRREKNYNLNEPHHGECICLNDTVTYQNRQYSNHKKECCKVGLKDKVIVLWPNNSKNAIDFTSFKYYHRLTLFSSLANRSNKIMICFCIQACNKARLTCSSCATNSMKEIHSRCSKFSLKWNTKKQNCSSELNNVLHTLWNSNRKEKLQKVLK